jgi:hypothetical protein
MTFKSSISLPKQSPEKIICVLGMHRSGTSCLTGSLKQYGLELGQHSNWNPYNRKGNMENSTVVDFHEMLMTDSGGSWDNPPKKVSWSETHLQQMATIIENNAGNKVWGFKDPRTLIALDGWKHMAPSIEFIGVFRHPISVAQSLNSRSGGQMSIAAATSLWYQYNKRLLKEYRRAAFPLLCFDWDEETFHSRLDEAVGTLGFDNIDSPERFFNNDLVQNREFKKQKLPWHVRRLYKQLCKIAESQRRVL